MTTLQTDAAARGHAHLPSFAASSPVTVRRARFNRPMTGIEFERAARRLEVAEIKVNTDVISSSKQRFDELLQSLRTDEIADGAEAEELEAPCVCIPGGSGVGKSHLLRRLRENPLLVPFRDSQGPVRPLVAIKAPSPCTSLSLARKLYAALTGDDLPEKITDGEAWRRVRAQLDGQLVSVIMIDEFHHAFIQRTTDQCRALVQTLKNFLVPNPNDPLLPPGAEPRPIMLVLAGMPWLDEVIVKDLQLKRRRTLFEIKPLEQDQSGIMRMRKFLNLVETKLPFPEASRLTDGDMVRRFFRASNGWLGRAMALVKDAAFLAIERDARRIDVQQHLAVVYTERFGFGGSRNPFLIADIDAFKPLKDAEFERLTLLRGKAKRSFAAIGDLDEEEA